jgi:hypothetical protein
VPLYDLACTECGTVHEDIRPYQESRRYRAECVGICGRWQDHVRLPSLFASYMGEKVQSPIVLGGKFDTAGHAKTQRLPDFKEAIEHDAHVNANIAKLGRNPSDEAVRDAARAAGPGPSTADWREHIKKPAFKEAKKQQNEQRRQNRLKRMRAKAINRGENVSVRRDRLPGDPKFT